MKSHIFIFLIFFILNCGISESHADEYKVLFVNSKDLNIGEEKAKPGMVFKDTDEIKWKNANQFLKVRNLSTHKTMELHPSQFKTGENTIKRLILSKRLSTREWERNNEIVETPVPLWDTVFLPVSKNFTPSFQNFVIFNNNSNRRFISTNQDNNFYILPRLIFNDFDNEIIKVSVMERDGDFTYPVYEDLEIEILPFE